MRVANLRELPANSVTEVFIEDQPYAICRLNDEVRALGGVCPHSGGPIGQGQIAGSIVVCPWHAWEFDCRTGQNNFDPTIYVPVYEVKLEGEDVLLQVP